MHRFKYIYIFGGTNLEKDKELMKVANELDKVMAPRGINLVYQGEIQDLRGYVIIIALIKGSKVMDISVKKLGDKNCLTIGIELKTSSLPKPFGIYVFQ